MLRRLLDLAYLLLLVGLSPILLGRMLRGKYRSGWGEKLFGRLPALPTGRERVWFHAVSVGEVLQLRSVVVGLRERRPGIEVVVTSTTTTGHAVARETFPDCTVAYCPLDFSWAVSTALARLKPSVLVLVELELWPNLVLAAKRRNVPVLLVNGRLGERSHRGYRRIRPLIARLLRAFRTIAVQTETIAGRFRDLGAAPERIRVTGSVKFDHLETDRGNPRTAGLREAFALDHKGLVFVAGSTQHPEEALALDAYAALRREFPTLRLVLVPRHRERFDEVARLVVERGHALVRRSDPTSVLERGPAVRLLDTLGELGACWGLADVAFVGGSLGSRRGGQNMMEPAAYGAAVLFGPNTWNFAEVVESLLAAEGARVVTDGDALTAAVRELLADRAAALAMGERARAVVLAQRGATLRTLEAIEAALDSRRPRGLRRAA